MSSPMPGCTPMQKAQKAQNAGWLAGWLVPSQKYSGKVRAASGSGELRGSPAARNDFATAGPEAAGRTGGLGYGKRRGLGCNFKMALCVKLW